MDLNRRGLLRVTGLGLVTAAAHSACGTTVVPSILATAGSSASPAPAGAPSASPSATAAAAARNAVTRDIQPLVPPANGPVPVAITLSAGATVIDFAGPWEVFQDANDGQTGFGRMFELFTVGPSTEPIKASAGLTLVPDYSYDDAPEAKVIVVGAQTGSPELIDWIQSRAAEADVVMSVCTGAFLLGSAGLLDGRNATTHHDFYDDFEAGFPGATLHRDVRYTEDGGISTAGGLTSGIDLALRVVDRYFGRPAAETTAAYMEHESPRWRA